MRPIFGRCTGEHHVGPLDELIKDLPIVSDFVNIAQSLGSFTEIAIHHVVVIVVSAILLPVHVIFECRNLGSRNGTVGDFDEQVGVPTVASSDNISRMQEIRIFHNLRAERDIHKFFYRPPATHAWPSQDNNICSFVKKLVRFKSVAVGSLADAQLGHSLRPLNTRFPRSRRS